MQAAANGLGFAVAGIALTKPMISHHALVDPFSETVAESGTYYIVCLENWRNREKSKLEIG